MQREHRQELRLRNSKNVLTIPNKGDEESNISSLFLYFLGILIKVLYIISIIVFMGIIDKLVIKSYNKSIKK